MTLHDDGLVERLRGRLKDYDDDLQQTIAAGILPDRAAYGEDVSGVTYAEISEAADAITRLIAERDVAQTSHAAARANFLTMQSAAAQLLKRAERAEAALRLMFDAYEGVYNCVDNDGRHYRDDDARAADLAALSALSKKDGEK